jgi:hypothetical protein
MENLGKPDRRQNTKGIMVRKINETLKLCRFLLSNNQYIVTILVK